MDFGWRFAFGHPSDPEKDYQTGTGYFSYFAKAAYGDGAAAANFDDRSWRMLNLPHDWAAEQGVDSLASYSHGFKTVGRNFPTTSVGWYRKTFQIPAGDQGRRISIAFDGVFRNAAVWINGFYLGTEPSGYAGFEYNISEYLNYGGKNTIAVRVDATMEEGWFYEGAGIYRHTWLNKTAPVHVAPDGIFVSSQVENNNATVQVQVTLLNEFTAADTVDVLYTIENANGKVLARQLTPANILGAYQPKDLSATLALAAPVLWSLENPYLYKLVTTVSKAGKIVDQVETSFGIRTIRFDANQGFFLNGKHLKIQGTNNHQDHAGLGTALPDEMQIFRLEALKAFGCNAYRCSHHPPSPELLDACDRLGLLVIDENRLMGVSSTHYDYLKRMILRDRNHPSVISWSLGNEEWGIESNALGASIATSMQAYARSIDSTRAITAAISGGWQKGISNVVEVMGVNYIGQINTDEHHAEFPRQPMWGTEEGSTRATRGIYVDDPARHYLAAYDHKPSPSFYSIEAAWQYYVARDYLAGMFIWTGFDYRGEPTPFGYPSTGSLFGMLDQCGFPKDNVYYLKSWWTSQPTLHLLPHWNWPGKEGQNIAVWAYSNCDAVELWLNKKSLGRQHMPPNGHLEWNVPYQPGTLEAIGYKNGQKVITDQVQTTGKPQTVHLSAPRTSIRADQEDVAVITVELKDQNGLHIPTADQEISFHVSGPGKIIGVGNGDPRSLEPDKYVETIRTVTLQDLKEKKVQGFNHPAEVAADYDDTSWARAFQEERTEAFGQATPAILYRAHFDLPTDFAAATTTFFYKPIGKEQSIYINGQVITTDIKETGSVTTFTIDPSFLHAGKNSLAIMAVPLLKKKPWEEVNKDPGLFQLLLPAPSWKRSLFNGYAQVIVQSAGKPGTVELTATAPGLQPATLKIEALPAERRPYVPGNY